MADIVLNVEVRERIGSGGAREARRQGLVPGILYGGDLGPVAISVKDGEFSRALHTGKLLGHLVKLKYGKEVQSVIAKDVQFHPVTDRPLHFDLYRVDEHATIRIEVPVAFRNHEDSPGIKRGGSLNVNVHALEVLVPADRIPEELVVDLTGLEIGDSVRAADVPLPAGIELTPRHRDATVASIASAASMIVEEETAETEEAETEEAEAEEEEGE
jgi:large subunit ribosomal protein L25